MNVEGEEQAGEGASSDGAVGVPRASGEAMHPLQQGGGGETLGPGVVGEAIADIGEELLAVLQIEGDFFLEDVGEGFANARGPVTANGVGELEKRLTHVAAARREVRREILFGVGRPLFHVRIMFNPPVVELFLQWLGFFYGAAEIEPFNLSVRSRGQVRSW